MMVALVNQVQGPLCLILKKSRKSPASQVTSAQKNVLPLELSRLEDPHQVYALHREQNSSCGWGCEKSGLALFEELRLLLRFQILADHCVGLKLIRTNADLRCPAPAQAVANHWIEV